MMNLLALSLVATSLAVAGVFSPNPSNGNDQVILKEGHRAVVVEYADTAGDGVNTKVSISPPEPKKTGGSGGGVIEDQLSRAAASVAGVAQDVKNGPRELICDAYGKCKHRIAGVFSKAKEKAVEAEEEVMDAVGGAVDKAKDLASRATHMAGESAKEKAREAGEAAERVRDKAGEKVKETGEMARDTAERVKGKTGEMARETAEKVKGKTGEVVEETAEKVKETGKKGKKELSDILKRGKEVVSDAIWYVFWPVRMSSLMSMIQMLGFATAYGMSVWVTFIMSHVLAGVLPRQQFGMVQSKIYPVYFKAMVGSIGLALLGHLLGQRTKVFRNKADMLQAYNLMSSMLSVLGNLLFLEPKATKVMFERMKLEKEEGRGTDRDNAPTRVIDTVVTDATGPVPTNAAAATTTTTTVAGTTLPSRPANDEAKSKLSKLNEKLKKLNSYSSLLNISTLMGLTWHLVYLSQRLGANSS